MDVVAIREALDSLDDPLVGPVAGFEVSTGRDWCDEPAVWVYMIIEDDRLDEAKRRMWELRELVRETVQSVTGPEVWVYRRIRTARETEELRAAQA